MARPRSSARGCSPAGTSGGKPFHGFVTLDPRTGGALSSWHPKRNPELVKLVVPSGAAALVAGDKLAP